MVTRMTEEQEKTLASFPKVTDYFLRSDGVVVVHVPHSYYQVTFLIPPNGRSYRSDA